jgi:hypothetical protein
MELPRRHALLGEVCGKLAGRDLGACSPVSMFRTVITPASLSDAPSISAKRALRSAARCLASGCRPGSLTHQSR